MTNAPVSASAATAREAARAHDGKFGAQARSEADIDLETPAPAAVPAPFRSKAVHDQIGAMRTALWRQERELDAYAEKLAAKGIAHEVLAQFPTATRISVEMEHFDDGSAWRPQAILDVDGTVLADMLDEVETSDGGGNLYEDFVAGIDCEHHALRDTSGFVYLDGRARGTEDVGYPYYLDLQVAADLDDTVPSQLLDPSSRPLTAPEQVQLVQLASYYTDAERERLGELVVTDFDSPEKYAYARGELIEAEALVAPKRPGETNAGYAAGWALQDESNFNLHSVEIAVADGKTTLVAATDADTHGRPVEEIEPEDLEFIQESSALTQVIDRFELDKLTDEQLAVSGITRTEAGYRITNRAH